MTWPISTGKKLIRWEQSSPAVFYTSAFFLSYQIAKLFKDIRQTLGPLRHHMLGHRRALRRATITDASLHFVLGQTRCGEGGMGFGRSSQERRNQYRQHARPEQVLAEHGSNPDLRHFSRSTPRRSES